jgi:hypothetical protein
MDSLNTAVLLVVFTRLATTEKVFNAIRGVRPPRLYIASDGPRENRIGEKEKVCQVREQILSGVDWDCEIKTLFREKNIGCGPGVNNAIDWFFEHEEMGIILEDDTVPDPSFFYFCQELLIRYKDDQRIGMISGNNHVSSFSTNESYIFSKFKWTWGWATWRRSWLNQDINLQVLETSYGKSVISNMGHSRKSIKHWEHNIDCINKRSVSAWDYQWFLSLSAQNQLGIFPSTNLVANIGFGEDATHCSGDAPEKLTQTSPMGFPLRHPQYILPNIDFDTKYEHENVYVGAILNKIVPTPIKSLIKFFLRRLKNEFI